MTGTAPLGVAVADTSVLLAAFNRKDDLHTQGADALSLTRVLVVSPMVMTELDHLLTRRAGEAEAINAITRIGALAGQGFVVLPPADRRLYADAEQLLRQYQGHALGLADVVNAVLAWRLQRPAILSFDHHYRDVLLPKKGPAIEVFPDMADR
ncbi:type II toxin-antitoxin system VapC family toxin [Streptomyces sp. FH025]|uniref:type II toxin-antitoxin system VapC family toxin n=1 Tax=Streptomyces sp. FH025 TaxID=2815937 RepID=UPI001A9D4B21|nr:PIN domain-containing protein [Streptomyces sp. FH025]MBO1415896.1 PIN domain-containing protein [Streptomyces sp. FH025]